MFQLKNIYAVFLLFVFGVATSQITSSSVSGKVLGGTTPVLGAFITLIHVPTNTDYQTTTDKSGRFSLDNLNVGGPYKIHVTGGDIKEYTGSRIELALGDNDLPTIVVERTENQLQEVVIDLKKSTPKK